MNQDAATETPGSNLGLDLKGGQHVLMEVDANGHTSVLADAVTVAGAWVRPNPIPDRPAAAYFTLVSRSDDTLTGASTPVAGRAELHTHRHHDGMMQMVHVDSVPVTCGAPLAFAPGGYHVMLFDVTHPLAAGEKVPLTLTFEKAGAVEVTAIVGSGPAEPVDTDALAASVTCPEGSTVPPKDQMDHMQ